MTLDITIGGATSDSYGTLAEYETYVIANLDLNFDGHGHDTTHELNLRRAAQYLDRNYVWKGYKATQAAAMQWPRVMSELVDGYSVASDSIPQAIKNAQFELAYLAETDGVDLFATASTGAITESKVKVDVIEESFKYKNPREHPSFTSIVGLIEPYHSGDKLSGGFGSLELRR